MVKADIDTKGLERQLMSMAKDFGESNESAICRWGVHTCRDLVMRTQAWGKGTDARKRQRGAITKDASRAVFGVSGEVLVNKIASGKLSGLEINGQLVTFTRDRVLKSAQEVADFIDLNRTSRKGRVPRMRSNLKAIASKKSIKDAVALKTRRAGIAKGGWIGAGKAIGARQKKGRKITIGKNYAGYAHKFSSGGTASLTRSVWHPVGKITNNVPHAATEHVLKKSDARDAINEGGQTMKTWYETTMKARLKRKRKRK